MQISARISVFWASFNLERGNTDHAIFLFTGNTQGRYIHTNFTRGQPTFTSLTVADPTLVLEKNETYCLSFWYYLGGWDAGRLYVHWPHAPSRGLPAWSRDGNYSTRWLQAEVLLGPTNITNSPRVRWVFMLLLLSYILLDQVHILKSAMSHIYTFYSKRSLSHVLGDITFVLGPCHITAYSSRRL